MLGRKGLINVMPVPRKSAMVRVASVDVFALAIAAIWASKALMGRPADSRIASGSDPVEDARVWGGAHEFGDNVGVQNYHAVNSTGGLGGVRCGSSSSTPPRSAKVRLRTVMSLSPGGRIAAARIARASASIERP